MFYVIGIFILFIAGVNFMNLTTARASHRWKEIGVRKTVGAKKLQLFSQFIFQSMLLAFMALVLAVLLITFVPMLNSLIGRQLSLTFFFKSIWTDSIGCSQHSCAWIPYGMYPSFYMTSFNMPGLERWSSRWRTLVYQSGLVVLQFGFACHDR